MEFVMSLDEILFKVGKDYLEKRGRYIEDMPHVKEECEKYDKVEQILREKLSKEDFSLVMELDSIDTSIRMLITEYEFKDAFKMGARFVLELLGK